MSEGYTEPLDDEARLTARIAELRGMFDATTEMLEHLQIVDDPHVQVQFAWLRKRRRDLWDQLYPAIRSSWQRHYGAQAAAHRAQAATVAREMHAAWQKHQNRIQRREPKHGR